MVHIVLLIRGAPKREVLSRVPLLHLVVSWSGALLRRVRPLLVSTSHIVTYVGCNRKSHESKDTDQLSVSGFQTPIYLQEEEEPASDTARGRRLRFPSLGGVILSSARGSIHSLLWRLTDSSVLGQESESGGLNGDDAEVSSIRISAHSWLSCASPVAAVKPMKGDSGRMTSEISKHLTQLSHWFRWRSS